MNLISLLKKQWKLVLLLVVLLFVGAILAATRIHPGYFAEDKIAADTAEALLIRRFNGQHFDAIYDSAADLFKTAQSREKVVAAMKEAFDLYGPITQDAGTATTCFPQQVRMARWLRSGKGDDLTGMFIWYVADGQNAQLLLFRLVSGHSPVSSAVAEANRCDSRH